MVADTTIRSKINSEQSAIMAMNEVIAKVPELNTSKDLAYLIGTGYGRNKVPFADENTEKSHFRTSFGYSDNDGVFPTESLSRVNADLNAGTELNKWVSMDGKISLSRTKADNRPLYGDYGAISQLMRIPNNVRLDDLKQYSDETHAHVNWQIVYSQSLN